MSRYKNTYFLPAPPTMHNYKLTRRVVHSMMYVRMFELSLWRKKNHVIKIKIFQTGYKQ